MTDYLNVYDLNRKKIAVLENAYEIVEEKELNKIYSLRFSLPSTDPKISCCQPMRYVRYGETGELYRIIKSAGTDADISTTAFTCEHVITTLCDNVLFGSFTYGGHGIRTAEVINWLLGEENQRTRNWVLDRCDFDLNYEYNWEQENLLNALYSIPKEFANPYRWEFNTQVYPWKISLIKIGDAEEPDYYIEAGKNLLGRNLNTDNTQICTRLYPLGYGEGVNQLTIRSVNSDVPYLEAPQSVIQQYGIIEKVLVDRQFESAETLKAYAQTVLNNLSVPTYEKTFDVVDLYPITHQPLDQADVGKVCLLTEDGTLAYIKKTVRTLDDPGSLTIDLSTKTTGIVDTIADLADRVRIESVYAQGATQIYQHSKDANAGTTKGKGHVISLYFPSEMKQINKVLLKVKLKKFRMYTKTTEDGGGSGQTSPSTAAGGGSISISVNETENANWYGNSLYSELTEIDITCNTSGKHSHTLPSTTSYAEPSPAFNLKHLHYINEGTGEAGNHSHDIYESTNEGYGHSHRILKRVLAHNHPIEVENASAGMSGFEHTHTYSVPEHSHGITPGIFEAQDSPSGFRILVDGTDKENVPSTSWQGDITRYLLDSGNTIPRDTWIEVTIVPDTLAYVISSVFVQGFVQSRGGGNY